MSDRLEEGGLLIDRDVPLSFTFDGKKYQGYKGDTLASALLANGVRLVGRSFKYHRPRGVVSSGPEEPNALVNLGTGPTHEPNVRMTQVPLREGLVATSQNNFPSLSSDVGALNSVFSRLFSAGFYYKTFMFPRMAWKHIYEPVIRKAAGLGKAPTEPDTDSYEQLYAFCDVLVAGGGVAGLQAARMAGEAGAKVILSEQSDRLGGRLLVDDDAEIDAKPAREWIAQQIEALQSMDNVMIRLNACVSTSEDHGYALIDEDRSGLGGGPRHRLWRVRAKRLIAATGMIERPIAFANNDNPGVMLASAVRDYCTLWGVLPGKKFVVLTTNDDGYRTAISLAGLEAESVTVIDRRAEPVGILVERARELGITIHTGSAIGKLTGSKDGVKSVQIIALADEAHGEEIDCDCVAVSGGWTPVSHLYSHCGGKLNWDDTIAAYRPDPERPPLDGEGNGFVLPVGGANGLLALKDILANTSEAVENACAGIGYSVAANTPSIFAPAEQPQEPLWFSPGIGKYKTGAKHFIDQQNDVTVADVRLAAREGFESVEHAKRYTTLGMATDQGKTSNINGHAILADALERTIAEVGTTTFRPPYTPVPFGAIAGAERGALFKPVRETPIYDWHVRHNAEFEPVGEWRRPYRYQIGNEPRKTSIDREILRVRNAVGLLDASTLGKIIVSGPDAAKFLDLLYTNMMSSLKPGKCRYGLMCNDNGFLMDDGVVARLSEERFLVHTTSGGADRIHAWMEEWLQTEWMDFKVHVVNVTEQFAQIGVAGPCAKELLKKIESDIDFDALPMMGFAEGTLAGHSVRVFRISFSGELSYEIAVPSHHGLDLWELLMEEGEEYGIGPYGTEALHVLRAEKGFIVIGDETDGTVTPYDVGLSWAVSKKKNDFLGKRSMARSDLAREGRKQLVGLLTEDPQLVLPDGAHALSDDGKHAIGHVTSTYMSPTLGHSIAMALIEGGASKHGEKIKIAIDGNQTAKATIGGVDFYDPEGTRLDA